MSTPRVKKVQDEQFLEAIIDLEQTVRIGATRRMLSERFKVSPGAVQKRLNDMIRKRWIQPAYFGVVLTDECKAALLKGDNNE
jgi:Mn-dependent DtxR family transcriptional regulator